MGLHDLGKSIPGFQDKWPEGRRLAEQAGLVFNPHTLGADKHDYASS